MKLACGEFYKTVMARQEKIIQIRLESLHMALSGQYIFAIAFFSEDLVTKS